MSRTSRLHSPRIQHVRVVNERLGPMSRTVESPSRVLFGLFEADLQSGELWKAGKRIKIQRQPFKVLFILLGHPGEVVSREKLQLRLWGKDTIVDFDHSLGTAINKIREALGDSAENPRFIETLSRRGYRFIAPVGIVPAEAVGEHTSPLSEAAAPAHPEGAHDAQPGQTEFAATTFPAAVKAQPIAQRASSRRHLWTVVGLAVFAASIVGFFVGSTRSTITPAHIL